jgi:hypothetical protein
MWRPTAASQLAASAQQSYRCHCCCDEPYCISGSAAHQHGDELVEADVAVVRARARLWVVLDAHRLHAAGDQGSVYTTPSGRTVLNSHEYRRRFGCGELRTACAAATPRTSTVAECACLSPAHVHRGPPSSSSSSSAAAAVAVIAVPELSWTNDSSRDHVPSAWAAAGRRRCRR